MYILALNCFSVGWSKAPRKRTQIFPSNHVRDHPKNLSSCTSFHFCSRKDIIFDVCRLQNERREREIIHLQLEEARAKLRSSEEDREECEERLRDLKEQKHQKEKEISDLKRQMEEEKQSYLDNLK